MTRKKKKRMTLTPAERIARNHELQRSFGVGMMARVKAGARVHKQISEHGSRWWNAPRPYLVTVSGVVIYKPHYPPRIYWISAKGEEHWAEGQDLDPLSHEEVLALLADE